MQTEAQKLLNAVNSSTERWKRQGFQRRFSVTDLHGIEYQSVMTSNVPAQFYTSISYDFDKFAHWWFKIIVRPYGVKTGLKEGGSTKGSAFGDWDIRRENIVRQTEPTSTHQVDRYVDSSSDDDELETPPFFRNR